MNKIDLNGRCAVVTGGRTGFWRAITERFVASGAKVGSGNHDQPLAIRPLKKSAARVTAFKVDVSDLAAVEKTRDATLKTFGKIDILVNNAGIAGVNRTVWEPSSMSGARFCASISTGRSSAARRSCLR